MKIKKEKIGDVEVFTSQDFRSKFKILLLFTTKKGGLSSDNYNSLNIAYHVGDNPLNVYKNRLKILNLFGYGNNINLISLNQIHSNKILVIDEHFLRKNHVPESRSTVFSIPDSSLTYSADGIITDILKLPVMVMGADCNLILMADVKNRVVAAVHAGWRGVLSQIILNMLDTFTDKFNSKLEDIYVFFGPSIRKCCFKVNEDVFNLFYRKFFETSDRKSMNWKKDSNYFFIDLVNIILNDIIKAGIPGKNISDIDICTCCNNEDLFYSYRKKRETGRHAGIILLE